MHMSIDEVMVLIQSRVPVKFLAYSILIEFVTLDGGYSYKYHGFTMED